MFESDYADMCAGKFPLVLMGAKRRVLRAQTRERGPQWALARNCCNITKFQTLEAAKHKNHVWNRFNLFKSWVPTQPNPGI
jgi:hypothetical protein